VMDADKWMANLGTERDWNFRAAPNPRLNGRALALNMGKVLGGGSSINLMGWVRGHKNDWDYFATAAADAGSHDSVLALYKRIENWQGMPDTAYRGTDGPVLVRPAHCSPVSHAFIEAARSNGIPTFGNLNGPLMESDGGCSRAERTSCGGKRVSVFRSYVHPLMERSNLSVLTHALVSRVTFSGKKARGVDVLHNGRRRHFHARAEVVLCLGAIGSPKVLMQSGIGDHDELTRLGIEVREHLPGVGRNFQDHFLFSGCIWEYAQPLEVQSNEGEAVVFWKTDWRLDTPDLQLIQFEGPRVSAETSKFCPPSHSWTVLPGVVRPKSRGQVRLAGANVDDPVQIIANTLDDPDDVKAMIACVELCREIANSTTLRPFVKREVVPAIPKGPALEEFLRNSIISFWHQTGTAKMGRDPMAVVNGQLKVYGIEGLRVADGSIMPRVTSGNTMAPCVVIGERAADLLRTAHRL
jgi:choline dehydrogenase